MSERPSYTIDDDNYFGVSLLDVESYGGYHIVRTIDGYRERGSTLFFSDAEACYSRRHQAVTVEGIASSISSPQFAISAMLRHGIIGRDMDALVRPFAS